MSSSVDRRTGTKIGDRGNSALSEDVVKLLKTQDAGYIRTMLSKVRKERAKVEEGFMLDDEEGEIEALKSKRTGKGKHTVFVGDKEEQKTFDAEEWFGVEDEMDLEKTWNRPRKQTKKQAGGEDLDEVEGQQENDNKLDEREQRAWEKRREKAQQAQRLKVEALKRKEKDLMAAEKELEEQRARMSHNAGGVNKNGVKFKVRERKR